MRVQNTCMGTRSVPRLQDDRLGTGVHQWPGDHPPATVKGTGETQGMTFVPTPEHPSICV